MNCPSNQQTDIQLINETLLQQFETFQTKNARECQLKRQFQQIQCELGDVLGREMQEVLQLTRLLDKKQNEVDSINKQLNTVRLQNSELREEMAQKSRENKEPIRKAQEWREKVKKEREIRREYALKLRKQNNELREHLIIMEGKMHESDLEAQKIERELLKISSESKQLCEFVEESYMVKKKLNNELQELRGNIRVYCRIRPFLAGEDSSAGPIHELLNDNTLKLKVPKQNQKSENHQKDLLYNFEQIFDCKESQSAIFDQLAQLIQSSVDGKNVCIFAYGQTGSGKTYTMQGGNTEDSRGIIARSVELIYSEIHKAKEYQWKYSVSVSLQQVYLESLRDLLQPSSNDESITRILVSSPNEIYCLIDQAVKNRKVAETSCNEHSSRSHLIFTIHLDAHHSQKKLERNGSLNLVDLAGSERVGLSKVEGERMKETQAINKSLTQLGVVIMSLAKKEAFTPFRNSKLTHLLQKYLEGDSKTLMFVNISPTPSDYHQTICSLRFAEKVKDCKIKK